MPILGWSGWLVGEPFAFAIGRVDHWMAFGLLGFLGGKMLWESRSATVAAHCQDPTRGLTLVALSVASSLDALAVGLTLGFLRVSIWVLAAVVGLVAAGFSAVGIIGGSRHSVRASRKLPLRQRRQSFR